MSTGPTEDRFVLMWSGGKDAKMALDVLHSQSPRRIEALLTTVVQTEDRVTMHGTPLELIRRQAEALGLPLHVMRIPDEAPNEVYEQRLEETLAPLLDDGFSTVVAGDLFLEDVRDYRKEVIESIGARALFPLWLRNTSWLAHWFLKRGNRAVVTAVDTAQLDPSFIGRAYDEDFLDALPDGVDPCGEHGAFHTFVIDGPSFRFPVPVTVGEERREGRMRAVQLTAAEEADSAT